MQDDLEIQELKKRLMIAEHNSNFNETMKRQLHNLQEENAKLFSVRT
jgi:hypothetical protein